MTPRAAERTGRHHSEVSVSVSFKTERACTSDHCSVSARIHVITLAVADLDRAVAFYRDGIGLGTPRVFGHEFVGDATTPDGTVAMFQLRGGLMFALFPRTELAKDAGIPPGPAQPGGFSLGHAVASRADVDRLLARAEAAGATLCGVTGDRAWGIYSGYFHDLDGHLWEIMWNPAIDLDPE
jgi:hypothetical protein